MDLSAYRREYLAGGLRRSHLQSEPVDQFSVWFEQACQAGVLEPNAMSVATVGSDGRPWQRTVLLKKFDRQGFVFFTNLESQKARQIAENPEVCLLFPWFPLERQVIVGGSVERVSREESLHYFRSRPVESQLGAWASAQSQVISDRESLEARLAEVKERFAGQPVSLPPFWGGLRVRPSRVEFWQGGAARLHDRFLYSRGSNEGPWQIERLSP